MLQLVLVCCCPGLAGPRGGSSDNLFIPKKADFRTYLLQTSAVFMLSLQDQAQGTRRFSCLAAGGFPAPFFPP